MTTTGTTSPPLTLGMQLDAALARLDGLSGPQLYGMIVLGTVFVATLVLGNAAPLNDEAVEQLHKSTTTTTAAGSSIAAVTPVRKQPSHPEPRWYIFRLVNYGVLLAFGASVGHFVLHADFYAKDRSLLLRVLVAWCVCLIYFFGFFGVSIVHPEVTAVEEEASQQQQQQQEAAAVTNGRVIKARFVKDLGCGQTAGKVSTGTTTAEGMATKNVISSDSNTRSSGVTVPADYADLSDAQLAQLVLDKHWKDHELEKKLDAHRAVQVRRLVFQHKLMHNHNHDSNGGRVPSAFEATDTDGASSSFDWTQHLPAQPSLDYKAVYGANCEIVVGYVPLPVGVVGPLVINGQEHYVPMATTEGCLVASTNRGAKAITAGGGVTAVVTRDGITRAPCVRLPSAFAAAQLKLWCEEPLNFAQLQRAFASTTRYGQLTACQVTVAGRNAYVRLVCASGDAMGMNMVSKGSLAVIDCLRQHFDDLELVALSGNMCTDKKAAAVNWLQGRGKSVVVEAIIPADVVRTTLKTTVAAMVHTNLHKNLIGSAMAGALGGFNAHAANIVTAVFLATGQDPAQNVESSQCITLLEETAQGDLWISCTLPSLEVGTVGGGTRLAAQAACLEIVGCRGGNNEEPGANARKLAMAVASATLAGELSLLAALAANTLVQAHMQHNRKK